MLKGMSLAAAGLLVVACVPKANKQDSSLVTSEAKNVVSGAVMEKNLFADKCQVFVDRVSINGFGAYGNHSMIYNIKINHKDLDGKVTKVGAYVKADGTEYGRPYKKDWHEVEAKLVGGNDYFEYAVAGPNNMVRIFTEGTFFVDTEKGTRYWLSHVPA